MKINIKKDAHIGEQPIRVLKHNLTERLVERNEEYIKLLHSDFRLDKNIKYNIADLPLVDKQMPFVDQNGMINIHETYLSYVWIMSYYFFVLHEEGVAIPDQIRRGLPVHKSQNLVLISAAKDLFDYGKSLIKIYFPWDKENLPNPEYYDEHSDEGWYILRTNDLFVEVLNFVLYHESAHAEYEHINKVITLNLTHEARKPLEIEADTRAIELILSNGRSRILSELAIIIGLASMLFFGKNLNGGSKHPDIDIRLENAIRLFNSEDDSPVWTMLVLFLKVWNEQFSLEMKHQPYYDTYKDLYYDLLSQIRE